MRISNEAWGVELSPPAVAVADDLEPLASELGDGTLVLRPASAVACRRLPEAALAAIETVVREAVARVLATSVELGVTPFAAAFREAYNYLAQRTGAPREVLDELFPA